MHAVRAGNVFDSEERWMVPNLNTIVLVIVVLLLIGALPLYPYSRSWGYAPSGLLTVVLVVVLLFLLL